MNIKIGDKIRIIKMKGEEKYKNREGIVTLIDDIGQIHGTWGTCALNVKEDIFEEIK